MKELEIQAQQLGAVGIAWDSGGHAATKRLVTRVGHMTAMMFINNLRKRVNGDADSKELRENDYRAALTEQRQSGLPPVPNAKVKDRLKDTPETPETDPPKIKGMVSDIDERSFYEAASLMIHGLFNKTPDGDYKSEMIVHSQDGSRSHVCPLLSVVLSLSLSLYFLSS